MQDIQAAVVFSRDSRDSRLAIFRLSTDCTVSKCRSDMLSSFCFEHAPPCARRRGAWRRRHSNLRDLLHTFFYAVFTDMSQPGVDRFEDIGDGLALADRDQGNLGRITIRFGAGVGDAVFDALEDYRG